MLKKINLKFSNSVVLPILILFFLSLPFFSYALLDYVPLAPIPGTTVTGGSGATLSTYLTGIFRVGVAMAGVLAFLMIVIGGFQYLSTDAMTGKEEGKLRIERAVGGLILALTSYIILYTINPNLVSLDLTFGLPANPGKDLAKPGMLTSPLTRDEEYIQKLDASLKELNDIKKDPAVINAQAMKTAAINAGKSIDEMNEVISKMYEDHPDETARITELEKERDALVLSKIQMERQTGPLLIASTQHDINVKLNQGIEYATDNKADTNPDNVIGALRAENASKIEALRAIGQDAEATRLQKVLDDAVAKIEYRKRCPTDTKSVWTLLPTGTGFTKQVPCV